MVGRLDRSPERRAGALGSRRWAGIAAAIGLLVLAGFATWRRLTAPVVLPPPAVAADSAVQWEDFAGAEACVECHRAQYDVWRTSTHGRAGGSPSRQVVIARFNGVPIRFQNATVIPRIIASGEYQFAVSQPGRLQLVLRGCEEITA